MRQLYSAAGILALAGIVGCAPHMTTTTRPARVGGDDAVVPRGAYAAPTSGSLQMIVVITDDWDAVPGIMRRYERDGVRDPWRLVGAEIPVVVGSAGLGWGDGLHGIGSPGEPGPVKREGDRRSPAGAFRLTTTFGYAPRDSMMWIRMPYTQATDTYKCVDDAQSVHYNEMLSRDRVANIDWRSAENMRRADSLYRLGVVVEHNANGRETGHGSCIFLHIWPGADGSTVGCTAFGSDAMHAVLQWLEPDALPLLVQLPRSEYDRLRGPWVLP